MRAFCLLLVASIAQAKPPTPEPLPGGGKVFGRVRWMGPAPKLPALDIGRDEAACGKTAANERLLVGPGKGVRDAVVWLDAIEDAPRAKPISARVEQKRCGFSPHVQVVPQGSRLEIVNRDAIPHALRAFLDGATALFDFSSAPRGKESKKLDEPGVVELRCDDHPNTSAWIHVAPHPWYAVTGADGVYTLDDAPPGDWVLRVWHEGWLPLGGNPPAFSEPVLLQREISLRTSAPLQADFELRDL
jgi:hypothetical protein